MRRNGEESNLSVNSDSAQHDFTVTFDMGPSTGQSGRGLSLIQPISALQYVPLTHHYTTFLFFLSERVKEEGAEVIVSFTVYPRNKKKTKKRKKLKDKQNRKKKQRKR